MNITFDDIQKNLKNNKIYLEQDIIKVNHIDYQSKNNIFNDILLKNLLKHPNDENNFNETNFNETNFNENTSKKKNYSIENSTKILKYNKNSFISELVISLYERTLLETPSIREFKEKFLSFVNNYETKKYLKTCSNFHNKLQFKLNEIFNVDNIDEHLNNFPELIKAICKKFNINILILCDNIYKLYENDNINVYLIFNKYSIKYKDGYRKNYIFSEESYDITNLLKNKYKYYDEKELNKLKLDELKLIGNNFKINIEKCKKNDIICKILNLCNNFN